MDVYHVCTGTKRPERVFNPPELDRLQVDVSSPVWMLGLKLQSSGKAASTLFSLSSRHLFQYSKLKFK